MLKSNNKNNHKIRTLWDDVNKLIGLEEELLIRIESIEKSINNLWKTVSNLNKEA
ncbi:MAG TPA: hypothetical protein VGB37_02460 [Candidatus Lokiarchaeia archaeon]